MLAFRSFAVSLCFLVLLLTRPPHVSASDDKWLLFSDSSLSLLVGAGFELQGNRVDTLTFEHASGWKWGDLFIFFDATKFRDNPNSGGGWYGEFSPRFSLTKMGTFDLDKNSFIKDVLISTTFERGKNDIEALLIGGAIDFRVPGFQFFKVNAYARKDTSRGAGFDDMQWTLSWAYPINTQTEKFHLGGFVDYVVGWGPQETLVHAVTQVKWDIGHKLGLNRKVYLGAEIDIWDNQFGVKDTPTLDTDQFAVSALLKVHF